ncbi:DUF3995 domain-containing protein [Oceanobacillus jeddahense]|uniref:DUF3995 domain-containing protein n=1 Tax=Oceanobacillus jeddahense TaxID=1462527 RepID=A0ABY5JWM5_9BACI|nr:DUF3995 domain-containing protein [Oceanobacillus jeddahense]UUI03578.1 DUF3995 domain-containing protein [Oceanobacillus jeddahense]
MQVNKWWLTVGVIWTVLFAGMSFYWAMGGRLGVRSLGGAIYEMSLHPEPSFILVVWLTGFVKLLGALLLLLLLVPWKNTVISKVLYYLTKIAGVFLFVYGLLNFITISMGAFAILDMDLEAHATFWRLVFWEPFWMIGGICYFFSVKKYRSV